MTLIKSPEEQEKMRRAGKIWAEVMQQLEPMCKPGTTTKQIDTKAQELIESLGGTPGFLNYKPAWAHHAYPATICASVNDSIVHGIPNDYALKDGDLLTIDMGVKIEGYNVDAARTFIIGNGSKEAHQLVQATKEALDEALKVVREGATLGDVGAAIEKVAHNYNLSVVEGLTGHGVGKDLHEEPTVFNTGVEGEGITLKEGMCLAIEPMFSTGSEQIIQKPSDESYATKDGSLSAHFEHTVLVKKDGVEVLTGL
ncbi:MAG: type I methionyl aminopeptidase [Candidatus Paceibacterota bacterium]